jgi:alanine-synthesizing transaminase
MEEEGHKIIKLNIGNLAAFGFDSHPRKSSRT